MSNKPARFSQSDIARALKAAEKAGVKVEIIIEKDGTIRLVPADNLNGNNDQGAKVALCDGIAL